MAEPQPQFKTMTLNVDPFQGVARIATSLTPPKGYQFVSVDRKGTKAVVKWKRIDKAEA